MINVDVTPDAEVHIHRIGRTGRGDAEGLALNLVAMDEMPYVTKIEQLQARPSEWFEVAELTPAPGGALLPPMLTIQIIGGRKEKIRAGDMMGAMYADFGYAREQIGKTRACYELDPALSICMAVGRIKMANTTKCRSASVPTYPLSYMHLGAIAAPVTVVARSRPALAAWLQRAPVKHHGTGLGPGDFGPHG